MNNYPSYNHICDLMIVIVVDILILEYCMSENNV